MKEFTVFKPGTFTVMPNIHLKDKALSLKAVGLLSKCCVFQMIGITL